MSYLPLLIGISLITFGSSEYQDLQTSLVHNDYTIKDTTESPSVTTPVTTEPVLEKNNKKHNIEKSVKSALRFLISQRETDWGWRNDTPKVLTALKLLQAYEDVLDGLLPNSYELQLSSKQMEIEIVIMLWRHHEIPIAPSQLAQYCLSLSALCYDPRQFHGHDLIGTLQHHEAPHDLDFAYTTLAACTARAHVRKKQIRRLLDIANTAKDHNIDTVAMTILALRCIVMDHRHRNMQHSLRRPSISLARQQQPNGGFGNLYNTALVVQALDDLTELKSYWNKTAARAYLESRQDPDGAYTDAGLTSDVLLALIDKGLGSVRLLECGRHDADYENNVEIEGLTKSLSSHGNDSEIRNVTITYTLWIGSNVTENCTISITAPRNTSFYTIMQMAMDMDSHFSFEASEWPNGHYVHTLAGYKEEPMGYNYWLLYRLPELPDPTAPPANQLVAPVGVDDLLIEEGDHYLFWYKKL
ncbi:uncharacterized protein CG3556 isoform X2 [Anthonomus grandis grandis]|uniref:uncharacterized protein CG3556 isoform X2 n=1 Tax=Anthonomus grandis grandis TaxID=2921223 RepID=UPI002165991A|nr:uncharacterized protein CG3556 isoform X2 [Anthonomus grandis grandis]